MTLPDAQKIKIKSLTRKYDGFFKIDELIFDHPTFNGEMIEDVRREVFVRLDAVAVLPYDPVHDSVLLTRQLRIASAGKMESPWIVELIAGLVEKTDEAFVNVAEREAMEEAGLNISNLTPICDFFPSVGGSNEKLYLFLALTDLLRATSSAFRRSVLSPIPPTIAKSARCSSPYFKSTKRLLASPALRLL